MRCPVTCPPLCREQPQKGLHRHKVVPLRPCPIESSRAECACVPRFGLLLVARRLRGRLTCPQDCHESPHFACSARPLFCLGCSVTRQRVNVVFVPYPVLSHTNIISGPSIEV